MRFGCSDLVFEKNERAIGKGIMRSKSVQRQDKPVALIIGAGIGGISTAIKLAQQGYRVTVFEKNNSAGGRCGRLIRDGHQFDTGATLYLMPELYAQCFSDLGERVEEHLDLLRVDPTYQLFFRDGSTLALTSDLHNMYEQLEGIEPGSFNAFVRYLKEGYRHYHLTHAHLVNRSFRNLFEYISIKNILLLFRVKGLNSHYKNICKYFDDPRLRAAFTFQDLYMGISPYAAPATYSLMQYSELVDGVWYPKGGMYSVIEALMEIAQKWEVEFKFNMPVEQIKVNGHYATGLTLTIGEHIPADIMIANADLTYVYKRLLPKNEFAKQLASKKHTCSAVTFFWGLDKRYPQIGVHNFFVSDDYRASFDGIIRDFTCPDDPLIYVHTPTRLDPSMAPKGQDSLSAIVPVGHIHEAKDQDWPHIVKLARECVLKRLEKIGLNDIRKHIKFEVCYSPRDWENYYNLTYGSTHGLGHNLFQMGYLRPSNKHPRYQNLYFVGASNHPGTGIPTVMMSASLTAQRILQDAKNYAREKVNNKKLLRS